MKCPNCGNTSKFTLEFGMYSAISVDFEEDESPDRGSIEERMFVDLEEYDPVPTGYIQCDECLMDDHFHPKNVGKCDWGEFPEEWRKEFGL